MTKHTIPALADIGQAAQANLQAFSGAMGDAVKTLSGLRLPMDALAKLQADYVQQASALWNRTLSAAVHSDKPPSTLGDKRFAAQAWAQNPAAALAAQT